jgi:hypothetical protein
MCDVTTRSVAWPDHVHTCAGNHGADSDHKCSNRECRRWFYPKDV